MKKRLMSFAVVVGLAMSANAFANESETVQAADKEFVKDTYEYCVSMQTSETIDNQAVLECINSELDYYEYSRFASLEAALSVANAADDDK